MKKKTESRKIKWIEIFNKNFKHYILGECSASYIYDLTNDMFEDYGIDTDYIHSKYMKLHGKLFDLKLSSDEYTDEELDKIINDVAFIYVDNILTLTL